MTHTKRGLEKMVALMDKNNRNETIPQEKEEIIKFLLCLHRYAIDESYGQNPFIPMVPTE